MSKIRILSIAVVALLLINIAVAGYFFLRKPPHFAQGKPPVEFEGPKQVIITKLQFDAQQITEYEKLIKAHRASVAALEDSIRVLKNNLYQTLQDGSFTGKDSIAGRLGALQKRIELVNYDHFAALKQLCKPEQLENFNELTKELARFFAAKNGAPRQRP